MDTWLTPDRCIDVEPPASDSRGAAWAAVTVTGIGPKPRSSHGGGARGPEWATMKHKAHRVLQFAALPWRIGEGGLREVMLLTSRETHRRIIPKGRRTKGRKPAEVASQEAYEEAS